MNGRKAAKGCCMPLPVNRRGYPAPMRPGDPSDFPPKNVWLYAVQCDVFVKVGLAADMTKRLREFAGQNPFDVVLLAKSSVRADKAGYAERRAHEALAEFHHRGEWFRAAPEEAVKAIRRASEWARYLSGPWDDACAEYRARQSIMLEDAWQLRRAAHAINAVELEAMAAGEG